MHRLYVESFSLKGHYRFELTHEVHVNCPIMPLQFGICSHIILVKHPWIIDNENGK